jgi:hypothetical protein
MNMSNISKVMQTVVDEMPTNEKIVIIQKDSLGSILGNISVFLSAFLLSCGGCLAIVFNYLRRSNCNHIKCFGSECTRSNLDISED